MVSISLIGAISSVKSDPRECPRLNLVRIVFNPNSVCFGQFFFILSCWIIKVSSSKVWHEGVSSVIGCLCPNSVFVRVDLILCCWIIKVSSSVAAC